MAGGFASMKKTKRVSGYQPDLQARAKTTVATVLLLACAAAAVAAIAYYIIFPSRGYYTSDCTDTIYWAQASFDAKALYNKDFTYASLLPFGGSLLMLPWIGLFGVSMTTQTIGMLSFLVLLVLSMVFLLRTLGWNIRWISAAIALFLPLISLSVKMREIFWGHIIYYSLGLLFLFVGLALALRAWRFREAGCGPERRKFILYTTLLMVWVVLCSTDGFQAVMIFSVPMLAAFFSQTFFSFDTRLRDDRNTKANFLVLGMLIGSLLGILLGLLLTGGIQAYYENGYSAFSDVDTWFVNIGHFITHWSQLMDINVKRGALFISAEGILSLLKLLAALIIMAAPLLMLMLYRKIDDVRIRILVIAHWGMTAAVMFGYVFGVLASASWRLSPILGSSVFLTIVFAKWASDRTKTRRVMVLVLVPLALAASISLAMIARMPPDYGHDSGLIGIKDYLVQNDLTYGYATFWNANAVTVLSNSKVKVRNIEMSDKQIEPYYYQGQHRWYDDQPGQEEYFLLLTRSEIASGYAAVDSLVEQADRQLDYQDYVILIFENNLFPFEPIPEE
jgi:hypothetical protein